jgi:hypothetical protein
VEKMTMSDKRGGHFFDVFRWAIEERPMIAVQKRRKSKLKHDSPHYTDERFSSAQLIWGKEDGADFWVYSDRLWGWDYQKAQDAHKEAGQNHTIGSVNYYERMLQVFNDDDSIRMTGIMAGYNISNGYPYRVYGYTYDH